MSRSGAYKAKKISADKIFSLQDFDAFYHKAGGKALAAQNKNSAIAAAVSGGSDSVAMLLLLYAFLQKTGQEQRLVAVTIDHKLRAESAAEAAAVAALCRRLGIRHETAAWKGKKPATGISAAARAARYKLLAAAAEKYHAPVICVAHTSDDRAETYMMRKARLGDSAAIEPDVNALAYHAAAESAANAEPVFAAVRRRGLAGMARYSLLNRKIQILRPLLDIRRADLRAFLRAENIEWHDDPSNSDVQYERVRVRQALAEAETPQHRKKILSAISAAAEERQLLSAVAAVWGVRLRLHWAEEKLFGDLTALHHNAKEMQNFDYDALYLLFASAAAVIGGKSFIDGNNARLQKFILDLPQTRKGEPPQRISISGTVIEKRQNHVMFWREQRGAPSAKKDAASGKKAISGKKSVFWESENPFSFFVSAYDMPLFLLFSIVFQKNEEKKAAAVQKNSGICR